MRFTTCVGLVLLLVPARGAWCQEIFGSLQGRVLDHSGQPLRSVQILASGPSLPGERAGVTRSDGHFSLLGLPVGNYRIRIAGIGYRTVVYEGVTVQLGRTTNLGETQLEPQRVDLPELVVTGRPAMMDPTTAALSANLSREMFEVLPTDRDYQSIIALLPQANTSYLGDQVNIAGSTGLENAYFIDGVNVTDPYLAEASTRLPYNFVQEIQIKRGGYEAEFGKALGGIVNVVTLSGSNEFRGGAFGFFTNSSFAGAARRGLAGARVDAFSTYDVGLSLSGPIVRDRLWFFTAYNPSFERQDIEIAGLGVYPDRQTAHRFAGKLTWRAAPNTDLVFSAFGDPTTHQRVGPPTGGQQTPSVLANPDPFLGFQEQGGVSLSLGGRSALGRRLVVDGSIAWSELDRNERGATEIGRTEPRLNDRRTNTWSGGFGSSHEAHSVRTTGRVAGTLFLGAHTLKLGVEYEENTLAQIGGATQLGNILQTAPSVFLVVTSVRSTQVRNRVPTIYVQDSWSAGRRLTLNGGVRWDGQYLIGAGDSVAQAITNQWQPRIGFTLQPGELSSQKIFGSYGRFYQQLPLNLSTLEHVVFENCQYRYTTDPRVPGAQGTFQLCFTSPDSVRGAKLDGLDGQHFDEFALGYERVVRRALKLAVRGVYRTLRAAVGTGINPPGVVHTGNLGRGALAFLPEPQRDYEALEFTAERAGVDRLNFQVAYVLSRTYGNYSGLFASDVRRATPNWNFGFQFPEQAINSTGLLPNDRPHVLKVAASFRFDRGITAGTFFTWQSGTPLNEYGPAVPNMVLWPAFLVPRGSAGRTPTIWDLNLRLSYDLARTRLVPSGRVVFDLQHVGGPRAAVDFDQWRFLSRDAQGNYSNPNATFGNALAHQPPMTVRLGVELGLVERRDRQKVAPPLLMPGVEPVAVQTVFPRAP